MFTVIEAKDVVAGMTIAIVKDEMLRIQMANALKAGRKPLAPEVWNIVLGNKVWGDGTEINIMGRPGVAIGLPLDFPVFIPA